MRRNPLFPIIVPFMAIGLGACDPASQAIMAGASLVSFVHTDKTLSDHITTWAFDSDCSILYSASGEPYCQRFETEEDRRAAEAEAAAQAAQTHCYRTLGGITCYREPDTMASSQARVQ